MPYPRHLTHFLQIVNARFLLLCRRFMVMQLRNTRRSGLGLQRVHVVHYTKRHKQRTILQPTLIMPGTLPAFFHAIPVLFYHSFQATKPPGLFLKSAPTLEHSSFSRPLSITESVAGRRLVLLGAYAVTLQFSVLQTILYCTPIRRLGTSG